MAKFKEREEAVRLRKLGTSIADIALRLKVSKSTVSHWCKDISLSKQAINIIAARSEAKSTKALLLYTESLRAKRQKDIELDEGIGKQKIGKISDRDIFCIGLGLYWGEGYKRGSQEFGFTNSDPRMILFYLKWLEVVFGIKKDALILRVSINETHKARVKNVIEYWSALTNVPERNFTRSSLIGTANKKVYRNSSDHMGTLRVKVRRGTRLRRQVLGAIESIGLQSS